jgi:hypothetical protein
MFASIKRYAMRDIKFKDMAQQTAVEWLYNLSKQRELDKFDLEQAKAMEKEQITDAHIEGQRVFDKHDHTQWTTDQAEQYYNETYGKSNS